MWKSELQDVNFGVGQNSMDGESWLICFWELHVSLKATYVTLLEEMKVPPSVCGDYIEINCFQLNKPWGVGPFKLLPHLEVYIIDV